MYGWAMRWCTAGCCAPVAADTSSLNTLRSLCGSMPCRQERYQHFSMFTPDVAALKSTGAAASTCRGLRSVQSPPPPPPPAPG